MKGIYPPYPAEPIADIREMFIHGTRRFAGKAALQHKRAGEWIPITYRELRADVEAVAGGLAALGLHPSHKVAIVGDNRPEWAVSYLAAACTGIVCVPVDKELRETEVRNILELSGAQAVIADYRHIEMICGLRRELPFLASAVSMDDAAREGIISFTELKRLGRARIESGKNDFEDRTVTPDSLLSILFTSGTMGNPKGVMLTHRNIASNLVDAVRWVNLRTEDRFLSVLPIHHSYECTDGFLLALYLGATISYAENLRRFVENLCETRSTAVLGVPLLWHAVYSKIEAAMAERGMWKVNAAKKLAALSEKVLGLNIRRLLFRAVHRKLGGSLRILISGGAAVDPAVARGFRELGITFLQGYGLTESSPIIAVNRNEAFKDDAAGLPLPSVEVRIAEDGEILARGPNIMLGYYNNPDATSDALEDGWLHTGDLGFVDYDGFLFIRGRKKSVIVTSAGKKIYPEEVEAEILKSPYISECLVWGSADKDVIIEAIAVPDMDACTQKGLDRPAIESLIRAEVRERCRKLAPFKRVTELTVRYEELEKTTTRKVKRYLYTSKGTSDIQQ
ncbi:MAG: AMP-binding protein [Acidobacteria bacterium]|nr:AMP-binding protein [Acidobacteriota bacterium]